MSEEIDKAYDKIDKFLRNSLGDTDYAEYSAALEIIYSAEPVVAESPYVVVNENGNYMRVNPKRESLSQEEIYTEADRTRSYHRSFIAGVRFAEEHHGIGGGE